MVLISLQRGRLLKLYAGVFYEFDLVGGYGYAILMKKYEEWGNLLLVLPGLHKVRPERLEKALKPLLATEVDGYYMMFFPVERGLQRGLFRAIGIVDEIDKWFVPHLPESDNEQRMPWYWKSSNGEWSFMPSDVDSSDFYSVSTIALLRMLRGLDVVSDASKVKTSKKGRVRQKAGRNR